MGGPWAGVRTGAGDDNMWHHYRSVRHDDRPRDRSCGRRMMFVAMLLGHREGWHREHAHRDYERAYHRHSSLSFL